MKEYIIKYPNQNDDVQALVFAYGESRTEEILNEALSKNMVVELTTDEERPDFLDYKFVIYQSPN